MTVAAEVWFGGFLGGFGVIVRSWELIRDESEGVLAKCESVFWMVCYLVVKERKMLSGGKNSVYVFI